MSTEPPVELNTGSEPSVEPAVELNTGSEPSVEPAVELNTGSEPNVEPAVELNAGSEPNVEPAVELSVKTDQVESNPDPEKGENSKLVNEPHRRRRESRRQSNPSSTLPLPSSLPEDIIACFSSLSSIVGENEEAMNYLSHIEEYVKEMQQNLTEYAQECQRIFTNMEDIHYENQMLRDMYNRNHSSETIPTKSPSWMRPSSFKSAEETLELPNDVETLKKLVNEKYAVALMNERRYFHQKKQCQKYQLMLQTMDGDESSINSLLSQYRTLSDRGEQLKEENMDLKEKIRKINEGIHSRDDEIRQLTETIQLRENDLQRLEAVIHEYDIKVERRKAKEAISNSDSDSPKDDSSKPELLEKSTSDEENAKKMEQIINEKNALEKELGDMKQEKEKISNDLQQMKESKVVLENQVREMKESNAQLQSELEGARDILLQLQKKLQEKESSTDMDDLKAKNEELEKLHCSLEEQVKELEKREVEMKSSLEKLTESAEKATKREEELKTKNEEMEEENRSLRSLVEDLKKEMEEEEQREDELEKQLNSIMESIRLNITGKKERLQAFKE